MTVLHRTHLTDLCPRSRDPAHISRPTVYAGEEGKTVAECDRYGSSAQRAASHAPEDFAVVQCTRR